MSNGTNVFYVRVFYIVGFIDVDNNIGNFIASFSIFSFSFLVIAEIVFFLLIITLLIVRNSLTLHLKFPYSCCKR